MLSKLGQLTNMRTPANLDGLQPWKSTVLLYIVRLFFRKSLDTTAGPFTTVGIVTANAEFENFGQWLFIVKRTITTNFVPTVTFSNLSENLVVFSPSPYQSVLRSCRPVGLETHLLHPTLCWGKDNPIHNGCFWNNGPDSSCAVDDSCFFFINCRVCWYNDRHWILVLQYYY